MCCLGRKPGCAIHNERSAIDNSMIIVISLHFGTFGLLGEVWWRLGQICSPSRWTIYCKFELQIVSCGKARVRGGGGGIVSGPGIGGLLSVWQGTGLCQGGRGGSRIWIRGGGGQAKTGTDGTPCYEGPGACSPRKLWNLAAFSSILLYLLRQFRGMI